MKLSVAALRNSVRVILCFSDAISLVSDYVNYYQIVLSYPGAQICPKIFSIFCK